MPVPLHQKSVEPRQDSEILLTHYMFRDRAGLEEGCWWLIVGTGGREGRTMGIYMDEECRRLMMRRDSLLLISPELRTGNAR